MTWNGSTAVLGALRRASDTSIRIASALYSNTSMTFDLNFKDQPAHEISLYFLDWDGSQREEKIEIFNRRGALLDSRIVSGFTQGTYLRWQLRGHVQIKITKISGPNVVVN